MHNVKAFMFVAEVEIRWLGTNAHLIYKSSLLLLNCFNHKWQTRPELIPFSGFSSRLLRDLRHKA
jgi:hypothetical protein